MKPPKVQLGLNPTNHNSTQRQPSFYKKYNYYILLRLLYNQQYRFEKPQHNQLIPFTFSPFKLGAKTAGNHPLFSFHSSTPNVLQNYNRTHKTQNRGLRRGTPFLLQHRLGAFREFQVCVLVLFFLLTFSVVAVHHTVRQTTPPFPLEPEDVRREIPPSNTELGVI